jgi:hypothetical protein
LRLKNSFISFYRPDWASVRFLPYLHPRLVNSGRTTISLAQIAVRRIISVGEGSWQEEAMNVAANVPVIDLTAHDLVSSALSKFRAGDTVSTRAALDAIRRMDPACLDSDDDLVELIVMTAIGKTMAVVFDHRKR